METRDSSDVINGFLNQVQPGQPTTVEVTKRLIEGKEAIRVDLRRPIETPIRRESPPRAHSFHSVEGFTEYLARYGGDDVLVLADLDSGAMSAVLDEISEDGFEIVHFLPKVHPLYAPWQALIDEPVPIKQFAQFVQTHKDVVVADRRMLCAMFQQIRLSKHITIQEGTGVKSTNGIVCEMHLQGNDKGRPVDLPESLLIQCPMFVDTEPMGIAMDLMIEIAGGDAINVRMTSSDAHVKRVAMIQKMIAEVKAELPRATVSLGKVHHGQWSYVEAADQC
jgi:hypothetical protein